MSIDIERILLELELLPEYDTQIMIQSVKGIDDPFYGIGRSKNSNHLEKEFTEPLFDFKYTNKIIQKNGMYRTRVMRMKPKTCYTYHRDRTKRMHIPLVTNEKCMFIVDDIVYRYPADGKSYLIDTTLRHTAINASFEDRIHIVGCI
jgi:hypothetical protein